MNPLTLKLDHFVRLTPSDRKALDDVVAGPLRRLGPRDAIADEGDTPRHVSLLLSGWACRFKRLPDGRRQIVGFVLPGDLCDANVCLQPWLDHSIGTLSAVTVRELPQALVQEVALRHPRIGVALWRDALANASIAREWMLSLGQRTGVERLAHLLCELFVRLRVVGLTAGLSCELPPTQAELGKALGLSTVHVNRTMQELRAAGLIVLKGGRLTILDLDGLMQAALFDATYLQLDGGGEAQDQGAS